METKGKMMILKTWVKKKPNKQTPTHDIKASRCDSDSDYIWHHPQKQRPRKASSFCSVPRLDVVLGKSDNTMKASHMQLKAGLSSRPFWAQMNLNDNLPRLMFLLCQTKLCTARV